MGDEPVPVSDHIFNSIAMTPERYVDVDCKIIALFESLQNVEKSSYVLGSELWESKFDGLLALVRNIAIVDVWEIRKHKLYDSESGSGLQLHTQSSPGERSGKFSQNGKFMSKSYVRKVKCI